MQIILTLNKVFTNVWFNLLFLAIALYFSIICYKKYRDGSQISLHFLVFFVSLIFAQALTWIRWNFSPRSLTAGVLSLLICTVAISGIAYVTMGLLSLSGNKEEKGQKRDSAF